MQVLFTCDILTSSQEEIEQLRARFHDHFEAGVLQRLAIGQVEELEVQGSLPRRQMAEGRGRTRPMGWVEAGGRPGDLVDGDRRDHVTAWKERMNKL